MTKKETVQNRDGQGLGTAASAAAGIDQLTSWPAINRTKAKVRKRLLIIAFKRAKGNGSVCGISRLLPVKKPAIWSVQGQKVAVEGSWGRRRSVKMAHQTHNAAGHAASQTVPADIV